MLDLQNQTQPLAHRPMHPVDNWMRLARFLMLGSEDGTYYVQPRTLTVENATAVVECLKTDGPRVVRTMVEISTAGRAPKNAPALFVLALAASPDFADAETVTAALRALPEVAATGTDLCLFAGFVENLRGWGRGLRSAIAEWYLNKPVFALAYQMLAYPHSHGWSHRDLLRLSHPKAATPAQNALFQWAVDGELGHLASSELLSGDLRQIHAFEQAKKSSNENEIVLLIEENRLTHELIPSGWKNSAQLWEALLPSMPYADLVHHLGKLTAVGLIQPQSPATALVVARLIDRKRIRNSRIHPIALLDAQLHYKQLPAAVPSVIDALDEAFHLAFENVEPIGQRIHLTVDASNCYEKLSAALAMLFGGKASNSVDAFVIVTDNRPPTQVLERMSSKLVMIAMAATDSSI